MEYKALEVHWPTRGLREEHLALRREFLKLNTWLFLLLLLLQMKEVLLVLPMALFWWEYDPNALVESSLVTLLTWFYGTRFKSGCAKTKTYPPTDGRDSRDGRRRDPPLRWEPPRTWHHNLCLWVQCLWRFIQHATCRGTQRNHFKLTLEGWTSDKYGCRLGNFPNLLMVLGSKSALSNVPPYRNVRRIYVRWHHTRWRAPKAA